MAFLLIVAAFCFGSNFSDSYADDSAPAKGERVDEASADGANGPECDEEACQAEPGEHDRQHGTAIPFAESPRKAASRAKNEKKLVMVLHLSGNFALPEFT
ncbi:MAG: hypothetical protein DWQ31_14205 [Planctomycetota bacterium]|nr:MAG: hypothetical protein DWQ31_14205 [Planctomycetota bacterium]REJ94522.1 MAG: hypothetical protein DWQ35_07910 [Planctomycetota bacterium]REK18616.1 MAG: hypothetical protein DWQ42_19560 [Planctomycetota bacterium]REK37512.1 MAG: hypothetical protein DWQ46_22040 [Planctomycetota bacterium]